MTMYMEIKYKLGSQVRPLCAHSVSFPTKTQVKNRSQNLHAHKCAFASKTQTAPPESYQRSSLGDPSQRKFLSLESTERGSASMSAGDAALRTATVHMQKTQRFCGLAESPNE